MILRKTVELEREEQTGKGRKIRKLNRKKRTREKKIQVVGRLRVRNAWSATKSDAKSTAQASILFMYFRHTVGTVNVCSIQNKMTIIYFILTNSSTIHLKHQDRNLGFSSDYCPLPFILQSITILSST